MYCFEVLIDGMFSEVIVGCVCECGISIVVKDCLFKKSRRAWILC